MIPQANDDLRLDFQLGELPTPTYRLHITKDNINGSTDGLQAMAQAIYLILSIERYQHLIYSWNYGVELVDLIGRPISYCIPEIKRRITEALLQDSRITAVDSFLFSINGNKVQTTFTAHTVFGAVEADKEVTI